MWIHVPETYSPSVADTEELNLDSKWLSELAQSVTWKTKSVQPRSLQHVWKTTPSIRLLSGLTCDPLTQSRGVAKWISSLEDSHVSPIQSLATKEEKTIQGNSQEKSSELQPDSDTQLSFSKMFPESSDSTGITYDPNYERWAMRLRKDSSQRQKLGHHIRGRDFSSWPTPTAMNRPRTPETMAKSAEFRKRTANQNTVPLYLSEAAANWPTPRVSDTEGGIAPNVEMNNGSFSRKNQGGSEMGSEAEGCDSKLADSNNSGSREDFKQRQLRADGLVQSPGNSGEARSSTDEEIQAGDGQKTTKTKNWPTPVSRDRLGMDSSGKKNPHKPPELYHSILPAQPNTKDGHDCSLSCRRLSPLFAEMLMGLPLGWTNDSEPLEMELFQQWQRMLGHILIERMSYES